MVAGLTSFLCLNMNPENPLNHHFSSGVNQELHHKLHDAAIKKLKMQHKVVTDLESLLREATSRIKNVRDYAELIDQEVKAAGKDHNREMLAMEMQTKFLDNFVHYNKDQLLVILAFFLTKQVVSEIV